MVWLLGRLAGLFDGDLAAHDKDAARKGKDARADGRHRLLSGEAVVAVGKNPVETAVIGPDTGANIGLRRGVLPCAQGWRYPAFFEIVQAGAGLVRRSRVSMMRPSGAVKDTTPAAFLLLSHL